MARKRKRQTVYTKTRNQILAYIRRQKKHGIEVQLDFPLKTERQLKQSGIKGTKLSAETWKLKRLKKQLKYKEALNLETGELASPERFKQMRLEAKRKAKRKAKSNFLPDAREIVFDNVFDGYIRRLSEDVPRFNVYGKHRNEAAYNESQEQRGALYSLVMQLVNEYGKAEIGRRLMEHPEIEDLLNFTLYGSNASAIQSASHEIADILTDGNLTLDQLKAIEDESEEYEDWAEPL